MAHKIDMPVVTEVAASLLFRQIPPWDAVHRREDERRVEAPSLSLCNGGAKGIKNKMCMYPDCDGHKISVQSTYAEPFKQIWCF